MNLTKIRGCSVETELFERAVRHVEAGETFALEAQVYSETSVVSVSVEGRECVTGNIRGYSVVGKARDQRGAYLGENDVDLEPQPLPRPNRRERRAAEARARRRS